MSPLHVKNPIKFFTLIFIATLMLCAKDYDPNWKSLDSRTTPQWYKAAKFGIFIHWGLYSVPAWGPKGSYAEWYLKGLQRGDSLRIDYHEKTFGKEFSYRSFIDLFKAEKYDPDAWANLFKIAGAKYVVLTAKHHDGFCLWPSAESNGYNSVSGVAKRDLLGDLNTAVKNAGLKSGFYYSLYEWEHPDYPSNVPKYVDEYMLPQFRDVVQRSEPDIIFSDGEWDRDSGEWRSEEFLAWLYNESNAPEDVVVNDRWGGETRFKHGGYFSTEYDPNSGSMNEEFIHRGWEECRGIGRSFGYNQNEGPEDYNTSEDLIRLLVDIVSRGGNLLLNVGPKADGTIPDIMADRLREIGTWLEKNGEAIYETTVNQITISGETKFTLSKDQRTLFAFMEDIPKSEIIIQGVQASGKNQIHLLGTNEKFIWRNHRDNLTIIIPKGFHDILEESPVYVFKIPVDLFLNKPKIEIIETDGIAVVSIEAQNENAELRYSFGNRKISRNSAKKYGEPFKLDNSTMLNVQSFAEGFQPSIVVSAPVNILHDDNGLIRRTYLGQWGNCVEMLESVVQEEQTVFDFELNNEKKNNFGHTFKGYIKIDKRGEYEFQTVSDDGSKLLINGQPVVDNDGLHSRQSVSGNIHLKKGMHQIEVQFFERGGQESLDVKWKSPYFEWRDIPAFKLFTRLDVKR